MSKPAQIVEYMGAMSVIANKSYDSADILTAYPTATMLKMKTADVSVSINGTPMFLTSFDDETYIPTTTTKYIFNKNCVVVIGKYITIQ